jgi:hypothetical protein
MDMVNLYIAFYNLTAGHALKNLRKKFKDIAPNASIQDAASILRYPTNVILRPIRIMSRKPEFHAPIIAQYLCRNHSPTGKPVELCPSSFRSACLFEAVIIAIFHRSCAEAGYEEKAELIRHQSGS